MGGGGEGGAGLPIGEVQFILKNIDNRAVPIHNYHSCDEKRKEKGREKESRKEGRKEKEQTRPRVISSRVYRCLRAA